jgi:cytochrome c-type biogenesis protein CcmF
MIILGRSALLLGLVLAPAGAAAAVLGALRTDERWAAVGRRALYALFAVLTVAMVVLEAAFLRSDFSVGVVATHSSTTTPTLYRLTAMWSSQEGSLLLWVWLLAGWSSLAVRSGRRRVPEIAGWANVVLLGFACFFLALLVLLANPFGQLASPPPEGTGLQPLLRYPAMMIHPPALYSGYTLWTVPFAFGVGALVTGRLDAAWIAATRRFALGAWLALGFGVLLGARWSWSELGWGGYWAWDPVENAALLPWLTGTAFLHSVMIQERRGLLRTWNVCLVLGTGILAVLGTFLVRSGVLESIHAFGASTLGLPFLGFIALLVAGSTALVLHRRALLVADRGLESVLSREAVFLLGNLVLVGLAFVIFWGTFFPLISEAVTGDKASVGPPWFDRYTVPLALAVVALAGLGPLMPWLRATPRNVARAGAAPIALAVGVGFALAAIASVRAHPVALAAIAVATFAPAAVAVEFLRAGRVRARATGQALPRALAGVVGRNRRRYGGYLVHVGLAVLLIGVAASSTFQHVRDIRLRPGQRASVGGYDVRYLRATGRVTPEKLSLGAVLDVSRDGRHVATLTPSRGFYAAEDPRFGPVDRWFEGEATSEVGLASGPGRDVWTAVEPDVQALQPMIDGIDRRFPLAGAASERFLIGAVAQRYRMLPPPAAFRLIVAPLVTWVWLGGLVMLAGALLALWPAPHVALRRVRLGVPRAIRHPGRA